MGKTQKKESRKVEDIILEYLAEIVSFWKKLLNCVTNSIVRVVKIHFHLYNSNFHTCIRTVYQLAHTANCQYSKIMNSVNEKKDIQLNLPCQRSSIRVQK